MNTHQAILVVSFGTSFPQTREKTIDRIEQRMGEAYPDWRIYRAWTSKMIMAKLLRRDGIKIPNVTEAMEQMLVDGITDLVVQPTHVINGIENDLMKKDALAFADRFHSISFGAPLLSDEQDNWDMIEAIHKEFPDLKDDEALVLMGHGTTHYANSIYAALDYAMKDKGYPNIHLGTVEAYPSLDSVIRLLKEQEAKKVILAPFMIVAGDHATNDMSGDDPDSWRSRVEAAGFAVECCMKGLGEYPAVQDLLIQHAKTAMKS